MLRKQDCKILTYVTAYAGIRVILCTISKELCKSPSVINEHVRVMRPGNKKKSLRFVLTASCIDCAHPRNAADKKRVLSSYRAGIKRKHTICMAHLA